MKKTFEVNINGKIFHIDEDAYELLKNYLSQLREAFPGEEGEEIVSDIECRISEHFEQRASVGSSVIVIEDVNNVIGIMGRPEEISEEADFGQSARDESRRPEPAAWGTVPPSAAAGMGTTPPPLHKKLFRDDRHKVFGGVIAGLGQYLGWDEDSGSGPDIVAIQPEPVLDSDYPLSYSLDDNTSCTDSQADT